MLTVEVCESVKGCCSCEVSARETLAVMVAHGSKAFMLALYAEQRART